MTISQYIRPVGEAVCIKKGPLLDQYKGFTTHYLQSGTQALQCALALAKKAHTSSAPEAILPAYACPDLVSACVGAGVTPILVDLAEGSPFPLESELDSLINDNTVAVVLVNFLGISPTDSLFDFIKTKNCLRIEDRAQSFAEPTDSTSLRGDLVVFSFGKGKPVSLLGGGALLVANTLSEAPEYINSSGSDDISLSYKLKVLAYNLVIHPLIYVWLLKLPGLNIGATEYKPPTEPTALPDTKQALLGHNIKKQQRQNFAAETKLHQIVTDKGYQPLANTKKGVRLLRFPFLMPNKAMRDQAIQNLNEHGICASAMYNKPLKHIQNIPLGTDQLNKKVPMAELFSDQLITLPCHSGVNENALSLISKALEPNSSIASNPN